MNSISFNNPLSAQATATAVGGAAIAAYAIIEPELRNIADVVLTIAADIIGSPIVPCSLTALASMNAKSNPDNLPVAKGYLALSGTSGVFSAVRQFFAGNQEAAKRGLLTATLSGLGIAGLTLIENAKK
jgi:hypothetical protein